MKTTTKSLPLKRMGKQDREKKVLLGLVEYFIKTGKPVGSNTLKEAGFEELSSATIRNYFARLEEEGYLSQPHISGGRLPTSLAYRTYADAYKDELYEVNNDPFTAIRQFESREIASLLQESAENLSRTTNCAVFLSAPRFDQDFVIDLKLLSLDVRRCLCVIITDFGVVQTEILHLPNKISSFGIKRMESYFHWRLTGLNKPENLEPEEEAIAQTFYNELMVRYIVGYSNFIDEEIYRTGFSKLLTYPDLQEAGILASSLALFENAHTMRLLLRECASLNTLKFWIGENFAPNCSVIAIPYHIGNNPVGSVGILGPTRLPYRILFNYLRLFSECVSEALTRNLYKFKITFRQPHSENNLLIGKTHLKLIEDKREE